MAKAAEVYAALRVIGASCRGVGSGESWATDVASTWAEELGYASGNHLMDAARVWIRTEERRPSLAQFMIVVKTARGKAVLQDAAKGCADCGESGWRHIAVHWFEARTRQRRSYQYTAACECELGLHKATSVDGFTFSQAIAQYKRREGFIELHCTDRNRLALPMALTMAPHQYQNLVKKRKPRRSSFDPHDALQRMKRDLGGE